MKYDNRKKEDKLIRSSAAEYLTYVAATGENGVELRYEDENIWLTQKMLSVLYGVSTSAINQHIKKIYEDKELEEKSTIKNFLIVQDEGNRKISRNVIHYNLQMIIAVGFKVDNERAIQFRKWANQIVKDFTIKGWVMDDERLKNDGSILTKKYFEEQFSGNTAAEIIYNRADSQKENMGLTSWKGAPDSKIHKYDVVIAKNYLSEKEIGQLERMVSAYLDLAEMQAMRHIPMTMEDWEERLNGFLTLWDHDVLKDNGKISAELAKIHAETEFEKYRIVQDKIYISDFDELLLKSKDIKDKK